MSSIHASEPRKVLPQKPGRIIGVSKADGRNYGHNAVDMDFAYVLGSALTAFTSEYFSEYTSNPSVVIITHTSGLNYMTSSIKHLLDRIIPSRVENVFQTTPEGGSNALPLKSVLLELSQRFDFIIMPLDQDSIPSTMCDVVLQVSPGESLINDKTNRCPVAPNGISVVTVDEYRYAIDAEFKTIYNLEENTENKVTFTPLSPFGTFVVMKDFSRTDTAKTLLHENALRRLMHLSVTGDTSHTDFVLSKEAQNEFSAVVKNQKHVHDLMQSGTRMRRASMASACIGSVAMFTGAFISPGLLNFLPGEELFVTGLSTMVITGGFGLASQVKSRLARRFTQRSSRSLPSSLVPSALVPAKSMPGLESSYSRELPAANATDEYSEVATFPLEKDIQTLAHTEAVAPNSAPFIPESDSIQRWEQVLARYQKVVEAWLEYEIDVLKVIEYPLMTDITCIHTANFHRAMNNAQMYKPDAIPSTEVERSPFFKAVQEVEIAFATAEQHAKKMRWSTLESKQKQNLKDSKTLMSMALDEEGASLHERQSAYKQARAKLEGVIYLPERAIHYIENKVALELEAAF